MPSQLSGAFVPPRRRRRKAYVPPAMLINLQVLDLLEISGSQLRAARSLAMHQTTVSRSYWDLAEQFRLQPGRGPRKVCRWGTSTSLRLLRLACRAHRLEEGRLRLATDALHQSLPRCQTLRFSGRRGAGALSAPVGQAPGRSLGASPPCR